MYNMYYNKHKEVFLTQDLVDIVLKASDVH